MKVICVMVATADGVAARGHDDSLDWPCKEDKKAFTEETIKHKAMVLGRSTYEAIGRPLPNRFNLVVTSTPEKFSDATQPGILEFFKGEPMDVIIHLSARGYESMTLVGGPKTNATWFKQNLVDELLLTVEPRLFGKGFRIIEGESMDIKLKLLETVSLTPDAIQLRYQVIK